MQLPPAIAAAIEAGDTVIASSARAARALRRLHGEEQRRQGLEAWQSADILDWDSWLNRLWQRQLRSGQETRLLLTSLQEQQVWARLVRPSIEKKHLISVLSVSELAQTAYGLLCAYDALDFLRGDGLGESDVESFRSWARSFQQECRREDWLSRSLLPLALLDAVQADQIETTGRTLLIGFDRITPARHRLIEAFRQKGYAFEIAESVNGSSLASPLLVRATDKKDEVATCAFWVRSQLSALGGSPRIAVVVPDVAAMRPEIDRTFRQILAPQTALISGGGLPLPFEFSLGSPLAQLPMVRAALLLLRWMHQGLMQDQASWLLLSGLICRDEAEQFSIARFDARLRQQTMRQPEQDLNAFLDFLNKAWPEAAPLTALRQRLMAAQHLIPASNTMSFAEWVQRAGQVLDQVKWPGAHPLGSEDFQVKARWSDLLDATAALAFDGRKVGYGEFIEVLEQQANQTIYAPESHDAPVQVLGPFEAAGLNFDALWFLGADDASWPPVARAHPFLTKSLQRKHEMPHANSDVDWKLAEQVTARLIESVPRGHGLCVFSYGAQNADGACRPSTLVNSFAPEIVADAFRLEIGANEDLAAMHDFPAALLDVEPAIVVPWPAERDAGGADVLRNQAACPFRSFATRRFAARPMDAADWGLDPRARGSLVHSVLDKVWAELVNREGLVRARKEDRVPEIVSRSLNEALQRYKDEGLNRNWNQAYLAAEHARVLSIIDDWLTYEQTRADFSVEVREEKRSAAVGELRLQVRVDRIDQVGGGRVIIDYKTGKVKTDIWDGPRPDDPQLPIYAAFGQVQDVQGVLLGRVAEDKLEYLGRVANNDSIFDGGSSLIKPPYSEAMLQEWQNSLLELARAFSRGEAQVDPKQYPKTCKFCDLPGLCRIAESGRATQDEADASDGEPD